MKILGIIPARGGSKGVPGKNIAEVNGKPLIEYSIRIGNEAVNAGILERCIVSTDCDEIKKISEACGGEAPFLRPDNLAADSTKSVDVILHAIDFFSKSGRAYDAVLLLQPTCPIRLIKEIEEMVRLMKESGNDSVISVYKDDYISDMVMYTCEGTKGKPMNINHNIGIRRQDQKSFYIRNGTYYLTKVSYIKAYRRMISDIPEILIIDKSRSINVDTKEDLEYLRWKMSR